MRHEPRPPGEVVSKGPGDRSQTFMAVLGALMLFGGIGLGVGVVALRGKAAGTFDITARHLLDLLVLTTVCTLAALVAHEALHGVGMALLRARPRFGAGLQPSGMPYLYTTSAGHRFTRWQYVAVAALPNVVVNLFLLSMLAFGSQPLAWIMALAVHLSGGMGDLWLCWAALAERPGTLIEDERVGIRVFRPGFTEPAGATAD